MTEENTIIYYFLNSRGEACFLNEKCNTGFIIGKNLNSEKVFYWPIREEDINSMPKFTTAFNLDRNLFNEICNLSNDYKLYVEKIMTADPDSVPLYESEVLSCLQKICGLERTLVDQLEIQGMKLKDKNF